MTCHYPDLGSASDWLNQISHAARPIRSTTQIWVVTRHQYGISALVSQTSFRGETTGGVAKCRLFSPTNVSDIENREWEWLQFWNVLIESCRFEGQNEYEIQLKVGVPVLKKRHPGKLHFQGAKKVILAACHSGKLKLTFTSPNIISTSPKRVLTGTIDFTVLL